MPMRIVAAHAGVALPGGRRLVQQQLFVRQQLLIALFVQLAGRAHRVDARDLRFIARLRGEQRVDRRDQLARFGFGAVEFGGERRGGGLGAARLDRADAGRRIDLLLERRNADRLQARRGLGLAFQRRFGFRGRTFPGRLIALACASPESPIAAKSFSTSLRPVVPRRMETWGRPTGMLGNFLV
jgi:hypothetical protein